MNSIYIIGREGIWPDHNNMRGPILIESAGYPAGYPRTDFRTMDIIHDGEDYFIVKLEGKPDFCQAFKNAEPLCADSLEELLTKCFRERYDGLREQIRKKVCDYISDFNYDACFGHHFSTEEVEELQNNWFYSHFIIKRPTKDEIVGRNLRPG